MKENCHSKHFTICKLLKQHVLTYPPLSKCGKLFGNLFGFKELPSVDLFSKKPYAFLLDYKSALIKREWISCDDMSWLTQIIMERIKWVWLTDSQAAKQSHHQTLLTYLLTHSLTHSLTLSLSHSLSQSINQSIGQSINGSRNTLHTLNITFVTGGKLTGWFVCVLSKTQWLLLNIFLLIRYCCKLPRYTCFMQHCWTKKIIRYIYYSQN